jgi:hypothetical protein
MTTPFMRHMHTQRKKKAITETAKQLDNGQVQEINEENATYNDFEVLKASLEQDVIKSKDLFAQGPERNDYIKNTLIGRYMTHIDDYLKKADIYANPVLVQMCIWLFDLGDIVRASKLAFISMEQSQQMPAPFKRSLVEFMFDSALSWAEFEAKNGRSIQPYFNQFYTALDIQKPIQVVCMKYHKFAGMNALNDKDYSTATELLTRAEEAAHLANTDAKVKTKLNHAKKLLAEQTDTAETINGFVLL